MFIYLHTVWKNSRDVDRTTTRIYTLLAICIKRPSIAAVTASVDAKASRYVASIRIQRGRTEIIADLANMVKELLKDSIKLVGVDNSPNYPTETPFFDVLAILALSSRRCGLWLHPDFGPEIELYVRPTILIFVLVLRINLRAAIPPIFYLTTSSTSSCIFFQVTCSLLFSFGFTYQFFKSTP
ncbi:unnamed protein product [Rhizophagus irregularis]|nr:unnamed protein product [Rhizophagus irregularis]